MNERKFSWALLAVRLVVGGVFAYAGIRKILAPSAFAESLAMYRLLPESWIPVVALSLPMFEAITGLLLMTGWQLPAAALAVFGLSAGFAVAMATALARGIELDCGCFGSEAPSRAVMWLSLGRDLLLLLAAGWIYFQASRRAVTPP